MLDGWAEGIFVAFVAVVIFLILSALLSVGLGIWIGYFIWG